MIRRNFLFTPRQTPLLSVRAGTVSLVPPYSVSVSTTADFAVVRLLDFITSPDGPPSMDLRTSPGNIRPHQMPPSDNLSEWALVDKHFY